MRVAIALGGSLLDLDRTEYIAELGCLLRAVSRDLDLYLVTGGGRTARAYIRAGRSLGAPEEVLDRLGIAATRLNALLVKATLDDQRPVSLSIEEAAASPPPVVMGGTVPGHSTDAVAAMLARAVGARRLVIATDVDGIYTADPKRDARARRYQSISIGELRSMCPDEWRAAGTSSVVDGIACRIIEEERLPSAVVSGKNLQDLENAIYGREFNGTTIEV
ncbi:MAG: UMP kinase [Thermoplasmatota archaeon]